MDRWGFYTDGKNCWNPPLSVFNVTPIQKNDVLVEDHVEFVQEIPCMKDLRASKHKIDKFDTKLSNFKNEVKQLVLPIQNEVPLELVQQQHVSNILNIRKPRNRMPDSIRYHFRFHVKKSLKMAHVRKMYYQFERKCLDAGISFKDIYELRSFKYDPDKIQDVWLNKKGVNSKEYKTKFNKIKPYLDNLREFQSPKIMKKIDNQVNEELISKKARIDWEYVSVQMNKVNYPITSEDCKYLWFSTLGTSVRLPSTWSQQDYSKLKALTLRSKKKDFNEISKIMGPGYTPTLCFRVYAKFIRPLAKTETSEQKLAKKEALEKVWETSEFQEDFIDAMEYSNGSYNMAAEVLLTNKNWRNLNITESFLRKMAESVKSPPYRIGIFSTMEDVLLILTTEVFSIHDSPKNFEGLYPWRPNVSWNNRLRALILPHREACGVRNNWKPEEDQKLINLKKDKKTSVIPWTEMTNFFHNPQRTRKQLIARFLYLKEILKNQTLDQFHSNLREHYDIPFYYLRRCLFVIEYVEKHHKDKRGITIPSDSNEMINVLKESFKGAKQKLSKNFDEFNSTLDNLIESKNDANRQGVTFPPETELQNFVAEFPLPYVISTANKIRKFLLEALKLFD